MSNDRELLELAAKAAEMDVRESNGRWWHHIEVGSSSPWNPLTDDGDALRLVVKLGADVTFSNADDVQVVTFRNYKCFGAVEQSGDDPYVATRRAIVRAAAEIGRNMK